MIDSKSDSAELVDRALAGSSTALESLLLRYRERLKRMVQIRMDDRLSCRFDASDVVQDALLSASQRVHRYADGPRVPFYVWLRQIARDRLADLYQRHVVTQKRTVLREQKWGLSQDSVMKFVQQFGDLGTEPDRLAIQQEMQTRLYQALECLPDNDREIVVMRHLEQMTIAEIAAACMVSEGAVKMRQLRAVRRLRAAMHDNSSS